MKKQLLTLIILLALGFSGFVTAQVTGVKTIPGDYASIQAAITDLNTNGVGSGGATFNITAGYTETPAAALVLTMATNPSTASRPLVFQKSGTGANPLITAFVGTSTTLDGLFVLNGADYVTINGIDLQENAANTAPTTQMEFGYALLKTSATNGCQNNTIKNCTVSLSNANTASRGVYAANHNTTAITALTLASLAGTNSNNKFYNNKIQNCYFGYSLNGFAAAAPFDFYDQNNEIGIDGVSTNLSQIVNFGGGTVDANGVFTIHQNNIKIFNTSITNTGAALQTGALNGISLTGGTNANVDIYNNTITLVSNSNTGTALLGISNASGVTGAGNTVKIYNNNVSNCTYTTNTTGFFRAIASSGTATYTNINNNTVSNNSIAGTGDFSGIHYSGSSATLCLLVNLNNNIVNNNTKTGTAGAFYGIFASASTNTTNTYSNQIFNNSAASTSGAFYGYYNFAFGLNENVYSNQIYGNTAGSGENVMIYARSGTGPTNKEVYSNTIYNNTANTANLFGAIWLDYATIANIYRNTIYNLTNNTTTGAIPAVFGISVGTSVNTQVSTHNNFISELKAPNASNANAIYGIWLQGSTSSNLSAYYNTVHLNATSTGVNFGTAALVCGIYPTSIDLRNNILSNISTAAGTGFTLALVRGNATITNYNVASGYNCLYAGTPSATNLLYSDGTNTTQTLQAFKNLVGPREQASFSSLPPFVNVATSPYDLHLQAGTATQCEAGGTPIAGITIDFDNVTRNVTTPDVGADEFTGTTVDIASPNIQYALLTNSGVAATRNLASFATITDPSGVNTTAGTRPRLYFKKSTQANTFNSNSNATDGWKFVEATNTTSPYNFTINYALLFGGGTVVATDVIQYFVAAQDLNATPNVGLNNGGFTTQPANVNLAAANFPLTNTINQYTIVANVYNGVINVGPTETITSLTNAGGMFALINAGALSGNVTLNVTGDLTAETGTVPLNQWAEEGAGGYTISMVPSAAVTRTISGSSAANSLIRFDGADRVNIDGRFGGSGTFLTFRNTANTAPTISFINDAQNNTVQYAVVESGNTAVSNTLGGAILIGTTTGLNGNDNNTISNCDIRDRSDIAGTSAIAINCQGSGAGILSQFNNNVVISNNKIYNWFLANNSTQFALNIGTGNSNFTITGNSFYQTTARTNTATGAVTRAINISNTATVNSNGGNIITNNFIGGTAPLCAGGDMTYTVAGVGTTQTFVGISVISGLIPNSIQGNVIRNIDFTTNVPTVSTSVFLGINVGQGIHNVGTTTGNSIGSSTTNNVIKLTFNSGTAANSFIAGILSGAVNGYSDVSNNTIGGITISGSNITGGIIPQWIQVQGTPVQTVTVTNNLIGSTTLANSINNLFTTPSVVSFGIRNVITSGVSANISGNTIQNVTNVSTNAGSSDYGIFLINTAGSQANNTVANNTIKNISNAAAPAAPAFSLFGIALQGYGGLGHSFTGNDISGLYNTNIGAFGSNVVGIQVQGSTSGGTISNNRIYDLRNANTGAAGIAGIYLSAGKSWTANNNRISISNTTNTNDIDVSGIIDFIAENSNLNLNYNSIYLGGTATGTKNSFAYNHGGNATISAQNNLLYSERTGGTGGHYAIGSTSAAPALGWNVSNYNGLVTADASKVGLWGTTITDFATWKTSSGKDANSISDTNTNVTSTTLFVSSAIGNLKINTSLFPEGKGIPLASVLLDFDGDVRSLSAPTIGSDEVQCTAIAPTITSQNNVTCNGLANGSATIGVNAGNGVTYSWSPSGGTAATATGLAAGNYVVTINKACGTSTTVNVAITQPIAINNALTQNAGVLTATQSGATYIWYTCPNTLISGATNQTFTPLVAGDYKVEVTVGGCTATSSCITVSTLGNESFNFSSKLTVYPNPSSDVFFINSDSSGSFVVYDLIGKIIKTETIDLGITKLDLGNYPTGVYLMKVTNENNETKTVKLVKQ